MTDDLNNDFGMRCPKCHASDKIDVCADIWVRLCPDGTDPYEAQNQDHEWNEHSGAVCCGCGFGGNVSDFSTEAA
jgi:hypothetical protein